MESQDERQQYSKYILYGRFGDIISCTEEEFQKIRNDLKTGCKFQRQIPSSKLVLKNFGMCRVNYWYYQDNGVIYYLVTNDVRREIIQFLDSHDKGT